ncbi:MAG: class I SAM-dependent methyltransferase [Candidatus Aminicenantes bacterium]|nr:class I SAM-dependent methyltransferase [Candidatus Aminicenantes bacterium]
MEPARWHEHYVLQAEWLSPSRHYLYRKVGLARRGRILDLGCGTGVIGGEMKRITGRPLLGVDRDPALLNWARSTYPGNEFLIADERSLCSKGLKFDLVVLSFVLMWQPRPLPFLKRIRRLLADDGVLLLLAEPDYGGRIDHPAELDFLKEIFVGHIAEEGGDPFIGRRLPGLLRQSGFQAEVGLASGLNLGARLCGEDWEREWRFWRDLAGFSEATLRRILRLEKRAASRNERLVLFPVFYGVAAAPRKSA